MKWNLKYNNYMLIFFDIYLKTNLIYFDFVKI